MAINTSTVSVITGGASGIGLACARLLSQRGDRVVVLDLPGARMQEDLVSMGARFQACDVADERSVLEAAKQIEIEHGAVQVLVNSAGVIQPRLSPEVLEMTMWDRIMGIDHRGTYLCAVAFGRAMALRGRGAIVNIASITGSRSVPLHAYAPAKAAVLAMTQCLAGEWGRSGVRVNSVSPGYTLTPALQRAIDAGDRDPSDLINGTALGRLVRPEEVASAVAFLTSEASNAITGIDLPVDAGWLVGTSWQTYGGVPGPRSLMSQESNPC